VKTPDQKQEDFLGFLPSDRESFGAATSPVKPASFSNRAAPGGPTQATPFEGDVASSTVVLGDGPLVTVPDFSGWATRRVAQECEKLGLDLNVVGSGLAIEQNPAAGLKVPSGTRIWVRMAR
jgi:cell division protein FtsI (penicillin-binding protein 3)